MDDWEKFKKISLPHKEEFFKQNKEKEAIEDGIVRDIKRFFKKEEDYYKPVTLGNFWNNSYVKYEINSDRNKHQSTIKLYLKDIINNIQKSDTCII